jgi:hypothetical protein
VGEGQEDGLGIRDRGIHVKPGPVQVDVRAADRLMAATASHETHDLHHGVPGQQANQLGPGIPGGANDRDADPSRLSTRAAGEGHGSAVRRDVDGRLLSGGAHGYAASAAGRAGISGLRADDRAEASWWPWVGRVAA